MSSPTQRSLKLLRDAGYLCQIVERWNPHAKVRSDLFGFIDILAVRGDTVIGVQTTSANNMAARVAKIRALPTFKDWLHSPSRRVHVHGWGKKGPRGKRKMWQCRMLDLYPLSDVEISYE